MPDWLVDRDLVTSEYGSSKYYDLTPEDHLQNVLILSNADLTKKYPYFQSDGLIPNYMMTYPLLDPSLPFGLNYAGIGWLLFQSSNNRSFEEYMMKFDNDDPAMVLDNFESFTSLQTTILWWSRIWVCGVERAGLTEPTPFQQIRRRNSELMTPYFKRNFQCDSFLFRDRPKFNIDRFLRKDRSF